MIEVILKRFEEPDEARVFTKGRFETVRLGGLTIGRATYEPGWKWLEHVSPIAGTALCEVEHVGLVVSGRAVAAGRWNHHRTHPRELILYTARGARKLGDWRRTLYISSFSRR
jgi:hypothetical protein